MRKRFFLIVGKENIFLCLLAENAYLFTVTLSCNNLSYDEI